MSVLRKLKNLTVDETFLFNIVLLFNDKMKVTVQLVSDYIDFKHSS